MTVPYSSAFLRAIEFILPHEEDFLRGHWGDEAFVVTENVSGDDGGATKFGIDAASHPGVNIQALTRAGAIAIYHAEWMAHDLDAMPDKIAICCEDVWVNGGHAWLWLQNAINESSPSTSPRLDLDGEMGPQTLAAAKTCDQPAVVRAYLQERDQRFDSLAASHSNDRQFLDGWLQRDKDLASFLTA
jgi:lysozyme family protein